MAVWSFRPIPRASSNWRPASGWAKRSRGSEIGRVWSRFGVVCSFYFGHKQARATRRRAMRTAGAAPASRPTSATLLSQPSYSHTGKALVDAATARKFRRTCQCLVQVPMNNDGFMVRPYPQKSEANWRTPIKGLRQARLTFKAWNRSWFPWQASWMTAPICSQALLIGTWQVWLLTGGIADASWILLKCASQPL